MIDTDNRNLSEVCAYQEERIAALHRALKAKDDQIATLSVSVEKLLATLKAKGLI